MVYNRKYRRRRQYRKPTRWANYKTGLSQLYTDVKMLKSLVNTEKKEQVIATTLNPTTTAVRQLLNGTAHGTTDGDRIGNSIKSYDLLVRGRVVHNSSATSTLTRVIILWDHQPNGSALAATEFFQTENVLSARNTDYGKRFSVLFDDMIATDTNRTIVPFKVYRKLKAHVEYKGSTAAITDIATNSLYMMCISNEATNNPTVTLNSKYKFIDN